jgi:hypothetical protein
MGVSRARDERSNARRRVRRRTGRAPLVTATLVSVVLVAGTAGVGAFGINNHEAITFDGLSEPELAFSFLRPAVFDDIADEHEQLDRPPEEGGTQGGLDQIHFDDCEFDGAAEWIGDRYAAARAELELHTELPFGGQTVWQATDEFGSLLHTIMDFYAHSNWVEMGFPLSDEPDTPGIQAAQSDLVDLSGAQGSLGVDWYAPVPGGLVRADLQIGGVVRDVLLGSDDLTIPVGWEIREEGIGDDVPTLFDPEGAPRGVLLMTGEGTLDNECDVDNEVGIRVFDGYEHDETLNKDSDDRPGFLEARALAALQTSYEWCRLMSKAGLVGADGLLAALWVRSNADPHPAGAPCVAEPPGRIEVTVDFDRVRVLDDGDSDDNAPGEVNLAVALYDNPDEFHRSVHRQNPTGRALVTDGGLVADDRMLAPTTLCLDAGDLFSLAVHGWDNDDEPEDGGIYANDFDDKGDDDELLYGFQDRFTQAQLDGAVRHAASDDLEIDYRLTTDTDTDADGLGDCDERVDGTDPGDRDSDDDGIDDGTEVDLGTDPHDADSDDDGLPDGSDVEFVQHAVAELPGGALRAPGILPAITSVLDDVESALLEADLDEAVRKLGNLHRHLDGCGTRPDNNDWIVDCEAQLMVRSRVDLLIRNLSP